MIIFDTETTGLPEPALAPLENQPEIIEFAAVKLDAGLDEYDSLNFLVRPRKLPLMDVITKITGIRSEQLKDQKPFSAHAQNIAEFFRGEDTMVAHNVAFDRNLMVFEYRRLGLEYNFPWPWHHVCTVEKSKHMFAKYPKLDELYEHLIGPRPPGAHRALTDVRHLAACVRVMRGQGLL